MCVVEGHGEVAAVPTLCARVLYQLLGRLPADWGVDRDPIRQPLSALVDERQPSPLRPPRAEGVEKAVNLAMRSRRASALLLLVDADKDCPVAWGPAARDLAATRAPPAAVMAVVEYEAWLLAGHRAFADADADAVRNPKAVAVRIWPGYAETTHQVRLTRSLELKLAAQRSASFRKLVRDLKRLTDA